jgi:phosphoribosylformylglycinamidine synthase
VLVESCLRGGLGAKITLRGDAFVNLFSESTARAVVAIRPGGENRIAQLCETAGVPVSQLGIIGGDSLDISSVGPDGEAQELFSIPLVELRDTHERTQPSYAG